MKLRSQYLIRSSEHCPAVAWIEHVCRAMLGAPIGRGGKRSSSTRSQRGELISALLLVLVLLGLFTMAVLPSLRSKYSEPRDLCVVQLKQLDGAKKSWAAKNNKAADAVPTEADLIGPSGFFKKMPVCPEGGVYRLNAVKDLPSCTLAGNPHYHVLREPDHIRPAPNAEALKQ